MAVSATRQRKQRGFTLIELLVVVAILAISLGLVSLALPAAASRQLDREADRLSALLESARLQSRTTGQAVWWMPQAEGFRFEGLPGAQWPSAWLEQPAPVTTGTLPLVLGPEPILPPQTIRLTQAGAGNGSARSLEIHSDGVSAFRVRAVQP